MKKIVAIEVIDMKQRGESQPDFLDDAEFIENTIIISDEVLTELERLTSEALKEPIPQETEIDKAESEGNEQ